MTVADGNFGQPRNYTHWPGASSTWPLTRLINVNENRVGPLTVSQETDKVLDSSGNLEYTGSFLPIIANNGVSRIWGLPATTFIWARITPIVRSALVCGVLALALVSVMCLVAGIPVIPGWIQGLFAMGGVAVGAALGVVRGPAA
jgi:hypothetical protein